MKKALKNKNVRLVIVCFFVILLVAVILFFVFGRDKDKLDDTKEYNEIGLEIKPVADAVSEAKNVIGNTYQNLTLPDDFEIVCGDTLYNMTEYRMPEDNNVNAKERCMDLVDTYLGESYDKSRIDVEFDEPDGTRYSVYYERDVSIEGIDFENITEEELLELEKKLREDEYSCIYAQSDGYINVLYSWNTGDSWLEIASIKPDVYIIGKDNIDGVSYNISGTQYSLSDAVEFATKKITSDYMKFFPGCDGVVPYAVYVFTNEKGESFYMISFEWLFQGTPAINDGELINLDADGMYLYPCQVEIIEPDKISYLTMFAPFPTEKQEVEKIITLEAALLHLEDTLSPNSNYKITEVGLKYCRYREPLDEFGEPAPQRSVRPYWCFTVGTGNSMWGTYSPRKVIYVDAQNGDIYCYNSMSGEFEFKYIQEKQYEKED